MAVYGQLVLESLSPDAITFERLEYSLESVFDSLEEGLDFDDYDEYLSEAKDEEKSVGGSLKSFGNKIVDTIKNLIQKLSEFIKNIPAKVQMVVSKISMTLTNSNNEKLIKRLQSNTKGVLKKDVTIIDIKGTNIIKEGWNWLTGLVKFNVPDAIKNAISHATEKSSKNPEYIINDLKKVIDKIEDMDTDKFKMEKTETLPKGMNVQSAIDRAGAKDLYANAGRFSEKAAAAYKDTQKIVEQYKKAQQTLNKALADAQKNDREAIANVRGNISVIGTALRLGISYCSKFITMLMVPVKIANKNIRAILSGSSYVSDKKGEEISKKEQKKENREIKKNDKAAVKDYKKRQKKAKKRR